MQDYATTDHAVLIVVIALGSVLAFIALVALATVVVREITRKR